ncbi:hypothetical protein ACVILH_003076 [Bradyrhizobium sp. USDA 4353]
MLALFSLPGAGPPLPEFGNPEGMPSGALTIETGHAKNVI